MADWKQLLLDNPELFLLRYFSHKLEGLKDFHMRLIQTTLNEPRSIILYPAQHGKTTLVSTILPIYSLCKDPNLRIAIISKNEQDGKGIMRAIHAELLGNKELIKDFGPFRDPLDDNKAWTLERVDLCTRTKPTAKEGSIAIYGSKGNVLGKRFDWVICDDVVTEKNSATPEQRQGMREWFNLGVQTMPEYPWSRLTVVGTLFEPDDLYNDIIEMRMPETDERIYKEQREDAIQDDEAHITLWPERWPWERMMQEKAAMGPIDFGKRYRNIAVDASRLIFKQEYVMGGYIGKEQYPGCVDKNYRVGDRVDNWRIICGFDPALGVSRQAKFCAHLTLAVGSCAQHERCYWVVDLVRSQFTMPQQVDLIIQKHLEYTAWGSVIEVNNYQLGLEQAVNQKMSDQGMAINILPHHTTRHSKPDPEIGIGGMARMVANGQLHIPWGDQASRMVMQQLVDELVQYPGRTTDTVMALWFAWKTAQEQAPRYASYNRLEVGKKKNIYANHGGRRVIKNPAYS